MYKDSLSQRAQYGCIRKMCDLMLYVEPVTIHYKSTKFLNFQCTVHYKSAKFLNFQHGSRPTYSTIEP